MKIISTKKAFTLIELLVVITIMGILATGATTVYTSQIQKARDSTRITDIKALQSAIEQVYQDNAEYPYATEFLQGSGKTGISDYMESIPSDSKFGQPCNDGGVAAGTDCGYIYATDDDDNGIEYGVYELSTAFEAEGNVDTRAIGDGGGDDTRYETGLNLATVDTAVSLDDIVVKEGICIVSSGATPGDPKDKVYINGSGSCDS